MERLTCRVGAEIVAANYNEDFVLDMPVKNYKKYEEMKTRLADYEDIDLMPEEISEMKERQTPKKPVLGGDSEEYPEVLCPVCENFLKYAGDDGCYGSYCDSCGQAIDWD